jgi:hypothetical protein
MNDNPAIPWLITYVRLARKNGRLHSGHGTSGNSHKLPLMTRHSCGYAKGNLSLHLDTLPG